MTETSVAWWRGVSTRHPVLALTQFVTSDVDVDADLLPSTCNYIYLND